MAIIERYLETNHFLFRILAMQCPSGIRLDLDRAIKEKWDPGFTHAVYIDLPTGQVSYPILNKWFHLFQHLPEYTKPFDGHSEATLMHRVQQYIQQQNEQLKSAHVPEGK